MFPSSTLHILISQTDSFWGGLNLKSLQNLISTSKDFRSEFTGSTAIVTPTKKSKKTAAVFPSMIEHALRVMIRTRPLEVEGWTIRFSQAKYHFSLGTKVMIDHCSAFPEDHDLHLSKETARLFKQGYAYPKISFIDAFLLTARSSGGLKAAMARRHAYDEKVVQSGCDLTSSLRRPLRRMVENTINAINELENNLNILRKDAPLDKKKIIPGEIELRKGIRLLKQLRTDISYAQICSSNIKFKIRNEGLGETATFKYGSCLPSAPVRKIHTPKLEREIRELKTMKASVVGRYKAHATRYCPVVMTEDCLEGME